MPLDKDDMSSYYDYEESHGRRRKNRELIERAENVTDFEPFVIVAAQIKGQHKWAKHLYNWYLRHGYDFTPTPNRKKPPRK